MGTDWEGIETILREARAGSPARPSGGCPAPEELARLLEGPMGRKARARTMAHVADCPDCGPLLRSMMRLSREVDRLAASPGPDGAAAAADRAAAPRRPAFMLRRPAVAVLAGMIGLAVITFSIIRLAERPALRGSSALEIRLISPKKGETVAAADIGFRWAAVPKASRYVVELFGRSLEKIWRSDPLSDPGTDLPAEAEAGLQDGETYFWRVTAVLDDGQEILSKLADFSVRTKSP